MAKNLIYVRYQNPLMHSLSIKYVTKPDNQPTTDYTCVPNVFTIAHKILYNQAWVVVRDCPHRIYTRLFLNAKHAFRFGC